MGTQQNIELVKQFYGAYLKGDKDLLLSYMADDIDWDIPVMSGLEFSGRRRGRDEVAAFFGMVSQAQQLRSFEPQEFFGDADRVVVLGHHAWTVKSNGAPFDSDWVHIFTIRNGRVAAFRQSMDTLKVVQPHHCIPLQENDTENPIIRHHGGDHGRASKHQPAQTGVRRLRQGRHPELAGPACAGHRMELPEVEGIPFTGKRRGLAQVSDFFRVLAAPPDVAALP